MLHFEQFLEKRAASAPGSVGSISDIAARFISEEAQLKAYSGLESRTSILVGQVQSGKTGHYLGIAARVADHRPRIANFLLLTQSLIALQQQTLSDARDLLPSFEVFDESDEVRFRQSLSIDRPRLIVLKKVARPLRSWAQVLRPALLRGSPLFVIDDEADATGLNTRINRGEQSEINSLIERIVVENSAYLLQVTATPHAVFLQESESTFRPRAHLYFRPGADYLGGDFFFPSWTLGVGNRPFHFKPTDEDELSALDNSADDLPVPAGLRDALLTFILTAAFRIGIEGDSQCNFLLHPSAKTAHHERIRQKVDQYLLGLRAKTGGLLEDPEIGRIYDDLLGTKPQMPALEDLASSAEKTRVVTHVLNSKIGNNTRSLPRTGANVFIGGNVLSRGIVVPRLQTAYYCRRAKTPQLDTYWQHSRMFGYDRDAALVRVFMPPSLYRLFAQMNESVSRLFASLEAGESPEVAVVVPKGMKPTRSAVVRDLNESCLVGGSIYFPAAPDQTNEQAVSAAVSGLADHTESFREVTVDLAIEILEACGANSFGGVSITELPAVLRDSSGPRTRILLAVRLDRLISANTGTVLSQTDRELMLGHASSTFVMLYQVTGDRSLGWAGKPFWIPNVMLPEGRVAFVRP